MTRFKDYLSFSFSSLIVLFSVLLFSCEQEEVIQQSEAAQDESLALHVLENEAAVAMPAGVAGKGCQCSYQILSVNATPALPTNGGGPDYFLTGVVQDAPLVGGDGCISPPCANDFGVYVSVAPNGCQPFNPTCDDFIYDDLDPSNGSIYPTSFIPFKCTTPLFSEIRVDWMPFWNNSDCTDPSNFSSIGSTITFRIMCIDPSPLPDGCDPGEFPPQANVSPPMTITLDNFGNAIKFVDLIDCGCEPVEQ